MVLEVNVSGCAYSTVSIRIPHRDPCAISQELFVTTTLTAAAKALIARPVLADIATVDHLGNPTITPVWITLDGEDLIFNTSRGRAKHTNLTRNPHVAVSVLDPDDPFGPVVLRGVVEATEEGADANIDALAKKYMGVDSYPMRQPGEVRVIFRVKADTILMQPGDHA